MINCSWLFFTPVSGFTFEDYTKPLEDPRGVILSYFSEKGGVISQQDDPWIDGLIHLRIQQMASVMPVSVGIRIPN